MKFVVDLDDVVFKGFSTAKIRKEVTMFKMVYRRKELDGMDRGEHTWWNSGLGGFMYQGIAFGLVIVVQYIIFRDLTAFRRACRHYNYAFPNDLNAPPTQTILHSFYDLVMERM